MKHCKLQIETHSEGEKSYFETQGVLTRSDRSLRVDYEQEESVVLSIEKNAMRMERNSLSMHFIPQQETQAILRMGDRVGTISVFTRVFSRERTDGGYSIRLEYELKFPNAPQLFHLNVKIQFVDGTVVSCNIERMKNI